MTHGYRYLQQSLPTWALSSSTNRSHVVGEISLPLVALLLPHSYHGTLSKTYAPIFHNEQWINSLDKQRLSLSSRTAIEGSLHHTDPSCLSLHHTETKLQKAPLPSGLRHSVELSWNPCGLGTPASSASACSAILSPPPPRAGAPILGYTPLLLTPMAMVVRTECTPALV